MPKFLVVIKKNKKRNMSNPFQFILYVRPENGPDQRAINMIPSNAKIVVQNVHKLVRPLPAFLDGTPLLAEPRRQNIWRGSELYAKLDDYNEFIRYHPLSLMILSKPSTSTPTPQVLQFPVTDQPDYSPHAPPPQQQPQQPPQYAPPPQQQQQQQPQYAPPPQQQQQQQPQYAPPPQYSPPPPQYAPPPPQQAQQPPQDAPPQERQLPMISTLPPKRREPTVISAPQPVDENIAPLSPIDRLEDPNPLPPPAMAPVSLPRKRTQYPIRRTTSAS
jgi:hypothetical protein